MLALLGCNLQVKFGVDSHSVGKLLCDHLSVYKSIAEYVFRIIEWPNISYSLFQIINIEYLYIKIFYRTRGVTISRYKYCPGDLGPGYFLISSLGYINRNRLSDKQDMLWSLSIIFLMTHCLRTEQILIEKEFFFLEKKNILGLRKRYPQMHCKTKSAKGRQETEKFSRVIQSL